MIGSFIYLLFRGVPSEPAINLPQPDPFRANWTIEDAADPNRSAWELEEEESNIPLPDPSRAVWSIE